MKLDSLTDVLPLLVVAESWTGGSDVEELFMAAASSLFFFPVVVDERMGLMVAIFFTNDVELL